MKIKFYERCTSGCEYRNKCPTYKWFGEEPILKSSKDSCETGAKGKLEICLTRKDYVQQDEKISYLAKYFAEKILQENL